MTAKPPSINPPSVGVILTTYNGQDYIREQLDSLLNQLGVSIHIYAFDDNSSDDTIAILECYATNNPGVFSVFQNVPNSGGTGLNIFRNIVKVSTHHEYVALADQDDVWLPEKLKSATQSLLDSHADLYFSNLLLWNGKDEVLGVVEKSAPLKAKDYLFGGGSAGCTYVLSMKFFTHLLSRVSKVDLKGVKRISHDWLIYFLARHDGYSVIASTDKLIKYRIHTDSQYGGMSLGGFGAFRRKAQMLNAGFLREQMDNSLRFARDHTEDRKILMTYKKSRWGRLMVLLKFRFSLVRKKTRYIYLVIASLFLY